MKSKKKLEDKDLREMLHQVEAEFLLQCPEAPILERSAANVLDGIFFVLLTGGLKKILMILFSLLAIQKPWLILYVFSSSTLFLYSCCFLYPLSQLGGTPGKLLLGLKVIQEKSGETLPFHQALTRELVAKILLGICTAGGVFLIPAVNPEKKFLHDLLVKSSVKKVH